MEILDYHSVMHKICQICFRLGDGTLRQTCWTGSWRTPDLQLAKDGDILPIRPPHPTPVLRDPKLHAFCYLERAPWNPKIMETLQAVRLRPNPAGEFTALPRPLAGEEGACCPSTRTPAHFRPSASIFGSLGLASSLTVIISP